jgi:hypothetical protein
VSLFVLSLEIEDRDEVEVGNWAKHKKTFYNVHFLSPRGYYIFFINVRLSRLKYSVLTCLIYFTVKVRKLENPRLYVYVLRLSEVK